MSFETGGAGVGGVAECGVGVVACGGGASTSDGSSVCVSAGLMLEFLGLKPWGVSNEVDHRHF